MTPGLRLQDHSTLRDYLRVIARNKWVVLASTLLVPLAAVVFSLRQERLYQASAEVLLSRQNLAALLTGTQDPGLYQQAERVAQTQADLARVPAVAERTLSALRLDGRSAVDFLDASSVRAQPNADLLEFRVTDAEPALAVRLATEYARQFTLFRLELDTAALERARAEVETRIGDLETAGDSDSSLYQSLVEKEQQLSTMEALQTSNAFVVRPADRAGQVQPTPVRNGLLGLGLGVLLGVGIAFLRQALDTRVRSAEEVAAKLGLPLLARLPEPRRRLRARNHLVMLYEPVGAAAEAFRVLRSNLDFANLERGARTVMVTSAVESEGKSTTVANLAVALARAGRSVVLVDLDLRRPFVHRFFGLEGRPGVTDVALGTASLEQAVVKLAIARPGQTPESNGHGGAVTRLAVLPAGTLPPDAGEFVGSSRLAAVLEQLRDRADLVLVDAPPLLTLGDGLALSARIDGLLVVARLKMLRRGVLDELARVIHAAPAPALGFAVTDASSEDRYGYGYGYGDAYASSGGYSYIERDREPVA